MGWSQQVTTLNGATTAGAAEGNREIASITHDAFARVVATGVETDQSFGTVTVIDAATDSFAVRYDLADRTWSDGVPLDAADLMLAWAAGSNATAGEFDSLPTDLRQSAAVPHLDEFARRIDVSFATPVRDWQTALDVAVPAHVVGALALDIDDPMEAKQAVIDAITDDDADDLAKIAEVWNTGFDIDGASDDELDDLGVASGPYQVKTIEDAGAADDVTLEVNREHTGDAAPTYEEVDVVAAPSPLADFPGDVDVVQVVPTPDNYLEVRALTRRDHHLATTHAGRLWALVLRADRGIFRKGDARRAFLRATPRGDLTSAGAGDWRDAFAATQSLLFAPESDGYDIALEDAGFRAAFEGAGNDAAEDRARAGVPAGTKVCVLYDTEEPFAVRAYGALRVTAAESGWKVRDCGEQGIEDGLSSQRKWQAVLTTVPLPETPDDITETWGGVQPSPLTGLADEERARLAEEIAHTPDRYDARDLQVAIEAGLIQESLALPLAMEPVVTLSRRGLDLVQPESGALATLLAGAAGWGPES